VKPSSRSTGRSISEEDMSDSRQTPGEVPSKSGASRKPVAVAAAVLVGAGVVGGGWYALRGGSEPVPTSPAQPAVARATPPAQPAAVPEAPGEPLPPLGQSDARVRELVGALSSSPELAKWLGAEDLIRRFTAAVGNVSEGQSPRAALSFLAPQGPFQVVEREGRTFIAPASHARYDAVARTVASVDVQATARVYRTLQPLINEAYGEISRPGRRFDAALARAIRHLLDVPVPEGALEVVETEHIHYAYVAPELEQLSPAQKHLLRMGPTNARLIQGTLRELQGALALPTASR
jgi:hypothetical protein